MANPKALESNHGLMVVSTTVSGTLVSLQELGGKFILMGLSEKVFGKVDSLLKAVSNFELKIHIGGGAGGNMAGYATGNG